MEAWKYIETRQEEGVLWIFLNRPQKANALNESLWFELEAAARWAHQEPSVRVVVLAAHGKYFCSGIDFGMIQSLSQKFHSIDQGLRQEWLYQKIKALQKAFTALEECTKPVIAAVQGLCIGGGVDLITACDMRYASLQAEFCVKEVDLAIVADVGTLQRLPKIIGEGMARELAYTARNVSAEQAREMRLVNRVYKDTQTLYEGVNTIAKLIASKSPLTIRNTVQIYLI